MAIKYGNTTLTMIKYNGSNITQISYQGKVYKLIDTVSITFVEAGVATTVQYNPGDGVTRSTAPSGATFVGWSTLPSGANPIKAFTAYNDMTVYRVVKAPDFSMSMTGVTSGDEDDFWVDKTYNNVAVDKLNTTTMTVTIKGDGTMVSGYLESHQGDSLAAEQTKGWSVGYGSAISTTVNMTIRQNQRFVFRSYSGPESRTVVTATGSIQGKTYVG